MGSPIEAEAMPLATPAAERVFTTVLTRGPLSRVELARTTGLSPAAVTKAVRPLLEAGYLLEAPSSQEHDAVGAGRPAIPLKVDARRASFVGIKATGDELIGVVTDLEAGICTSRHLALASRDVSAVVAAIAELTEQLLAASPESRAGVRALGLAASGDIDRELGLVRYSPFLVWHDVELRDLVERATGLRTVIENDVRALTVAEHWFGAGVGARTFAVATVGAGIGCGLVVNGSVVSGAHGVAGELGHVPVPFGERLCHCGARGCVEAIAADGAIAAQVAEALGLSALPIAGARTLAREGSAKAQRVFARAGRAIGLALAAMANLVGPERIVISGEGVAAYDLLADEMRAAFLEQAFGAAAQCELILRPLPFEEWARGAAAVAIHDLVTTDARARSWTP